MNAQHYYRNISLDLDFASWATFTQGLSKISGVAFARFLGCCTSFLCKAVLTICGAIQTLTKALRPITDPERLERFPTFQHIKSRGNYLYNLRLRIKNGSKFTLYLPAGQETQDVDMMLNSLPSAQYPGRDIKLIRFHYIPVPQGFRL
jgi:hypothetical protein